MGKPHYYQKVINSQPPLIFVYGGAIFALPGTFFFGYSGAIFERPRSLFIDYSGAKYACLALPVLGERDYLSFL